LCVSSQGQDLYSHQKLNMYMVLIWERLQSPTPTPTTPDATVQPLGRHIANQSINQLASRRSERNADTWAWHRSVETLSTARQAPL